MMSQAVVSNVRGVKERVILEYKEHLCVASQKVYLSDGLSSTLVDSVKDQYFDFTSRSAKTEIDKANEGGQSYQILLAAVYDVVTLISEFRVSSWSLIHVCAYLLSPRGRPVLAGLCNVEEFDFSRRVRIIEIDLQRMLQACTDEPSNSTVVNVAVATELLGDPNVASKLLRFTQSSTRMAEFSYLFEEIHQRLMCNACPRPQVQGKMQIPDCDFQHNLRLRLLTFLYFPPEAPVCAYDLAKAGFLHTGKLDEIQCAECKHCSRDLALGDIVSTYKFHMATCTSYRERRLSFRVLSFVEFPVRSQYVRNMLAGHGLFYIGAGSRSAYNRHTIVCCRCFKRTDFLQFGAEPNEWHQPGCPCANEQEIVDSVREQIIRLSDNHRCLCCLRRNANIIALKCCHLVLCSQCYRESSTVNFCLRCRATVERCSILY